MSDFTTIKDSSFIKGAGQKVKNTEKKGKKKTMTFSFSEEVIAYLNELSEQGMNRSKFVENLIVKYKEDNSL